MEGARERIQRAQKLQVSTTKAQQLFLIWEKNRSAAKIVLHDQLISPLHDCIVVESGPVHGSMGNKRRICLTKSLAFTFASGTTKSRHLGQTHSSRGECRCQN